MSFYSKALDMLNVHKHLNAAVRSSPHEIQLIVRPHPWELARTGLSTADQERLIASYEEWLRNEGITRLTLSRKDKIESIRAADVVIVDGMSTIIPEVMILQKPVVSVTTTSWIKEQYIYNGRDGIVILKCASKLSQIINQIIKKKELRERIVTCQNNAIHELNYNNDGKAHTRLLNLVLSLASNNHARKHLQLSMPSSGLEFDSTTCPPSHSKSVPDFSHGEDLKMERPEHGFFVHPVGKLSRGAVLDVGLRCTHSCRFCYYSFLGGTKDQFRGMRHAKFRTVTECKEILRRLKQHGFVNFDYTGGEPSLHPDIIEITRYAHQELGLKGRMITLGQFLMKKTKNCRHEKLIEDLLQAGMVNFLFSLHAVNEELFHRITGGSFEKLRQAMAYLDARRFCYTANTTVFEWNYQHLPTIAEEIIKHRIYLHNFIIMNAYHEWNKDGKAFGVQAKYTDIHPHLRKAVEILESNHIGVNIRYAPLCTVKGMEKNLVGMVGVRYDPYEWMNLAGHFGGPPELCASVIPLQEGQIENYVAYRSLNTQFDNGVKITGARGEVKYFSDRCVVCQARDVCDGIDPNYLKIYGSSEFLQYSEPERAPLQKARYAYKIPFMVKTEQSVDMKKAVAEAFKLLPSQHTAAARTTAETQRHPRVSVIIPCYNYARYLPDAVRSVLSQTFQDLEIIIVNDGSTDNSLDVAKGLIKSDVSHRTRLIDQPNSGQPAISRNRGISEARGEYILCLDADDMIAPTLLEECVALLDGNPEISIAYPDQLYLLNSGKSQVIPAVDWDFNRLRYSNQLPYCSVYRRRVWEDTGGYNTNVRGYEDWDFWIAAGAKGHIGKRIPKALFHYRWHGSGVYSQAVGGDERLRSQIMLNHPQLYDQRSIEKASEVLGQRPSKSLEDKPRRPGLSFCIITAGKRNEKLKLLIESIHLQDMPSCEIIVAGAVEDLGVSGIEYVPMPHAANGGRTSMMRNAAAENSVYDNLVFCDDDIVLAPNWSSALRVAIQDYDLLTPTILNLDGTRHWDKASIDQRTQKTLNFNESSPHIYLTSGILVVRAAVWQALKWNERLGFYEAEDVDFSRRAQQMGLRLGFCREAIAIHNDARYTQVGRVVLKRTEAGAEAFLDGSLEQLSVSQLVQRAQEEYRNKHYAEMADCLRCCLVKDPGKLPAKEALRQLEDLTGGRADSAPWQPRPILSQRETLEEQFGKHGELPASTRELKRVLHYYHTLAASDLPTAAQHPEHVGIKWGSHILGFSGHAAHARLCLRSLDKHGVPLAMEPFAYDEKFFAQQPPEEAERWQRLWKADVKAGAYICFAVPLTLQGSDVFQACRRTNPFFEVFVGAATFETDRLPPGWAKALSGVDEVWVPSTFNQATFGHAGVDAGRIQVFPTGIDADRFAPGRVKPLAIADRRGFTFLSVFQWTKRKGWDILLKAYLEAFDRHDDVCLVLRAYPFRSRHISLRQKIDDFLYQCGRSPHEAPPIILLDQFLPEMDMPSLYAAADAFVLPTRGEGFGLPFLEAMAAGLPTIGTGWGGHLDFMNHNNSYLLDVDGLVAIPAEQTSESPFYTPDQRWAEPSVQHTAETMRAVFDHREPARARGTKARADVKRQWTEERCARWITERVNTLLASGGKKLFALSDKSSEKGPSDAPPDSSVAVAQAPSGKKIASPNAVGNKAAAAFESPASLPIRLVWEGAQLAHHSLALVNREVCGQLLSRRDLDLSLIPLPPQEIEPGLDPSYERLVGKMHTPLSGPADIHVRHFWPPNFTPPPAGRWVMIQPWEYGRLPEEWINPMTHLVDEIWVPSRHVLKTYLASGIPADRVSVIPNGVNTALFNPDAMPLPLATSKTFRFLFVGGTIWRKGIDLLLAAYARAFRRQDDVVLVIKDMGQNSFYLNQGAGNAIRQLQSDPEAPEVLYLTDTLNEQQMPGLFTACSCLAHPYRGEGFGLPVLEAMACGVPVMVTAGGATDDFCSADAAYLIPSRPHGVSSTETRLVGGLGWVLEADGEELVKLLRHVYEHPEEARHKAQRALATARSAYSWEKIADLVAERMRSLAAKPIRRLQSA